MNHPALTGDKFFIIIDGEVKAFVHRDGEAQICRRAVDSKREFGQIGQLVVYFRTFFLT